MSDDFLRPYLVIPKLIKQPTWGGEYIVQFKNWQKLLDLQSLKIGQSYELTRSSNLSTLTSSDDSLFIPEITTPKDFGQSPSRENSVALPSLIKKNADKLLGTGISEILLIKFTQALGNSFQLHVKEGTPDTIWQPKPESWYYFEPGIATLGVKKNTDWRMYQEVVTEIERQISSIGEELKNGTMSFMEAKKQIKALLTQYDPWQFVNLLRIDKEALIDLSACGVHHSWEEDPSLPLGNVLYEVQVDVADDVATIRNFDKGKLNEDGSSRGLNIPDYFKYIDRSEETNDPATHMSDPQKMESVSGVLHERLFDTKYYVLDRVTQSVEKAFSENIASYRHIFIKEGAARVSAGKTSIQLSKGHSCLIPAGCEKYQIEAIGKNLISLISYVKS